MAKNNNFLKKISISGVLLFIVGILGYRTNMNIAGTNWGLSDMAVTSGDTLIFATIFMLAIIFGLIKIIKGFYKK